MSSAGRWVRQVAVLHVRLRRVLLPLWAGVALIAGAVLFTPPAGGVIPWLLIAGLLVVDALRTRPAVEVSRDHARLMAEFDQLVAQCEPVADFVVRDQDGTMSLHATSTRFEHGFTRMREDLPAVDAPGCRTLEIFVASAYRARITIDTSCYLTTVDDCGRVVVTTTPDTNVPRFKEIRRAGRFRDRTGHGLATDEDLTTLIRQIQRATPVS